MDIAEDYLDVLQNLEEPIIAYYRKNSDLIDAEVLTAITWLIKIYNAEARDKSSSFRSPNGIVGEVVEVVKLVCESYLGRRQSQPTAPKKGLIQRLFSVAKAGSEPRIITAQELLACLRRIQSSIKFWTKRNGRQGYLQYVSNFVP
ncbi:MAG: hypothetical protein ACK58N_00760 [Synechocystis sp.]|jgi:hypothetical protein